MSTRMSSNPIMAWHRGDVRTSRFLTFEFERILAGMPTVRSAPKAASRSSAVMLGLNQLPLK